MNNNKKIKTKVTNTISFIIEALSENFRDVAKIIKTDQDELFDCILLAIEHHYDLSQMPEKEIDNVIKCVSVKITLKYLHLCTDELQEARENSSNSLYKP